jgi:serine/threonine protein phosphatase PrpC
LCAALTDADAALRTVTTAQPELQGMGSTAVIAVLRDSALHVANVGDSRAYLVRAGQAKLLSRDHSVAALLAERGEISPEEARKHPLRNQLRECLGGHRPPRPDYVCAPLWPGDRVVLCSDGLWDMVPDQQTAAMVAEGADPLEVARALVAAANASGGRDNITVIVLFPELGRPGES